ncbi:MAG: DNA translocase FtsK 4TM domain-containing protein [Thermoguttaceae bacterium]|nr:DNA translocase FtsK 4TM domain-containing protein [Thermoguttaceae bacterium]
MQRNYDRKREDFGRYAFGALLGVAWLFLSASILSYSPWDFPTQFVYHDLQEIRNIMGLPGAWCAYLCSLCFGVVSYALLLAFGVAVLLYFIYDKIRDPWLKSIGLFLILVSLSGLAAFVCDESAGPPIGPGGYVGAIVKFIFDKVFMRFGSYLALAGIFAAGLTLLLPDSCVRFLVWSSGLGKCVGRVARPFRLKLERCRPKEEKETIGAVPYRDQRYGAQLGAVNVLSRRSSAASLPARNNQTTTLAPTRAVTPPAYVNPIGQRYAPENVQANATDERDDGYNQVSIQPSSFAEYSVEREQTHSVYNYPPIELLHEGEVYDFSQIEGQIRERGATLEQACQEFKVNLKVVDYATGPVLTMYEVQLGKGLSVKRLEALAPDLAVKLASGDVRVVSPLVGKSTVGIEVPNSDRINVRLREVMEICSEEVERMSLPIFFGKDSVGAPIVADLSKLPHLLVAGSTGSGKSVCLNTIIMSLIMTRSPEQVKMIMIDPKMVELSLYQKIPHLMNPVVDDMEKAATILEWACEQMDWRYKVMKSVQTRNLKDFNALSIEEKRRRLNPVDEDEWEAFPKTMPSVVIIADEMADLIMSAGGKDVEKHIIRLAQKSRGAGIHLVLATQRPTRQVVTGLIKSNLPAKIAFKVTSHVDSGVILDTKGAEKLLGNGDMLFLPPTSSSLIRGQCAYVSDDEIRSVLEQINVEQPEYDDSLQKRTKPQPSPGEEGGEDEIVYDALYIPSVETFIELGKASASLLQRKFKIGYNRAARIVDVMTQEGYISPPNPSRPSAPREVYITMEDWRGKQQAIEDSVSPLTSSFANPERQTPDDETYRVGVSDEFEDVERNEEIDEYAESVGLVNGDPEDEDGAYEEFDLTPEPIADAPNDDKDDERDNSTSPSQAEEEGDANQWTEEQMEQFLDYDSEIDLES